MKLHEVILYARDMAAQVSFYRDKLGLEVAYPTDVADFSSEFWVLFNTGACKLALHGGGGSGVGADAPKIVFSVKDIHQSRDELLRRGVQLSEVRSPAPNVLVADGIDPEGNRFSLEASMTET